MLHRVALVRTDVSEECIASIIRVTRIGWLGTLAVTVTEARCTVLTARNLNGTIYSYTRNIGITL
jgi:hypothetical protein